MHHDDNDWANLGDLDLAILAQTDDHEEHAETGKTHPRGTVYIYIYIYIYMYIYICTYTHTHTHTHTHTQMYTCSDGGKLATAAKFFGGGAQQSPAHMPSKRPVLWTGKLALETVVKNRVRDYLGETVLAKPVLSHVEARLEFLGANDAQGDYSSESVTLVARVRRDLNAKVPYLKASYTSTLRLHALVA